MKGVMSFWTKPSLKDGGSIFKGNAGFPSKYYFAVSFWLSFLLARNWFSRVELVTDKAGYEFIKGIKIPFDKIIIELDKINHIIPELWAFGKMKTYSIQDEPFLHLDYDVFLLKKPEIVFSSQIITQNIEGIKEWYYSDRIKYFNENFNNLPNEWKNFHKNKNDFAYNVGIIGGLDYKNLNIYAQKGMDIISNNYSKISKIEDKNRVNDFNIVYEQYYLAAYMDNHKIKVTTLLDDFNNRHKYKYEHFIGGAKSDINNSIKIELFLRKHFPATNKILDQLKVELS